MSTLLPKSMRVYTARSTSSRRLILGRNSNKLAQMLIIGLRVLANSPDLSQTLSISNQKPIILKASRKWSNHSVSKNSKLEQQTLRLPRQTKWRLYATSRLYLNPLGRLYSNLSKVRLARACRKLQSLTSKALGLCACEMSEKWQSWETCIWVAKSGRRSPRTGKTSGASILSLSSWVRSHTVSIR